MYNVRSVIAFYISIAWYPVLDFKLFTTFQFFSPKEIYGYLMNMFSSRKFSNKITDYHNTKGDFRIVDIGKLKSFQEKYLSVLMFFFLLSLKTFGRFADSKILDVTRDLRTEVVMYNTLC